MTSQPVVSASGLPAPQRRNRWYNNAKILVPVILGGLLLLLALFVFGILSLAFSMIRHSEPYQVAIRTASESSQVSAEIGTPLHFGWIASGHINYSNADGEANLSIPISGPKGRGYIDVVGTKRAGRWTYRTLEVFVAGQSAPIELANPAPAPASPPAAPEIQPSPPAPPGSV